MEELGSFWCYYEEPSNLHSVEELKKKLIYKSIECESVKREASQEIQKQHAYIQKQDDQIKKLRNLVKLAFQERDECSSQLNKLLISIPTKSAASSITQSNAQASLSDFSTTSANPGVVDRYAAATEKLLEGKVLPEQGKLLQTVMNVAPLLNTLMVAAPLPCWKTPPTFHIPPPPPPPPNPTMITAQQRFYISSASQASVPNMNIGYCPFMNNQNSAAKRRRF